MKYGHKKIVFLLLTIVSTLFFVIIYMTTVCMGGCGPPKQSPGPFITYFPKREWRDSEVKTILLWTPNFGGPFWGGEKLIGKCSHKCRLTIDRGELDEADALLFHSRFVWNNFMGSTMPSRHPHHQVWVLNNDEPPPNVYLNMGAYNNVFNWTFWYRSDADVPMRYGKMIRKDDASISWATETDQRLKSLGKSSMTFDRSSTSSNTDFERYYGSNDTFISWVSSNCIDQGRRQRVVKQLQKYLNVDTFGTCGDMNLPCRDFKCPYLSRYRFHLAFENSVCRDYVTEKFWLSLYRGHIPIVYGGANYSKYVPSNSFINVRDFDDIRSLAEYIKKVDSDQKLYDSFFWWRKYYKIDNGPFPWCDICKGLHDRSTLAQVYSNLDGWYRNDKCQQFSVTGAVSRFIEGLLLKYNIIA